MQYTFYDRFYVMKRPTVILEFIPWNQIFSTNVADPIQKTGFNDTFMNQTDPFNSLAHLSS